jgi:hypothetical protein
MAHHEFQIQMLLLLLINHVPSSQLQLEHCFLRNRNVRVVDVVLYVMQNRSHDMQEMFGNFVKGQPMQATPSYK